MKKKAMNAVLIVLSVLLNISNLSAASIYNADYLVITHPQLEESSWKNKLLSILEGRGFSVGWLLLEDGTHSNTDIKSIIQDAYSIGTPLRFVLLIGNGKNLLPAPGDSPVHQRRGVPNSIVDSENGNFIPYCYEIMETWYYEDTPVPFDDPFISGLNFRVPVSIGRIPAENSQEVSIWVDKLHDYYANINLKGDWREKELFVSGDVDNPWNDCVGWKVKAMTDTIKQVVSDKITKVCLNKSEIDPAGTCIYESEDCWSAFEDAINDGVFLINIFSTGATWDNLGFFYHHKSNFNFNNKNKYPLLIGESCSIGEVMNPIEGYQDCVIKDLLFFPDGGIIASISPTVESSQWACREFSKVLHELLFSGSFCYYGDLLRETKVVYESRMPSSRFWHGKSHVLFGDPSMPLALYQYKNANITANTEWSGSIIVGNDISVSSGTTLTIRPGTGIFFKNNAQLKVYGTLIAQGTASYPIKFSAASENPSPGSWYGIRFEDSSNDANCILKYCDVQYAQYGVYCNRANLKIENNTIYHNYSGIYLYYSSPSVKTNSITNNLSGIYGISSSPYIYNNKLSNNRYYGVGFNLYSLPEFFSNSIRFNSWYGAAISNYSSPEFGPTIVDDQRLGLNIIADNGLYGVITDYYSSPFLGSTDPYNHRVGGYNSIYNNSCNVDANVYCNVIAEWNWWGSSVPPTDKFCIRGGSTLDYIPYLTSNPGGGSSLGKAAVLADNSSKINDKYSGFNPKKPNPNRLSDLWLWGHDLFINRKLSDAIDIYKILVKKFSQTKEAKYALVKVYHLYHELGKPGLDVYLSEIINNSEMNENLKPMALGLLAGAYLSEKNVNNALQTCEQMRQKGADPNAEKLALFNAVLAYKNDLNDTSSAKQYLSILKQKFPNDELTFIACAELGEKIDWSLAKRIYKPQPEETKYILPNKFALKGNYPNPFNPTTTIAFDLPEADRVSLTIYDLLGREVVKLVDDRLPAGFQKAIWDGKDKSGQQVSSGVYLYSLRTSAGFSATKKMALVR